MKKLTNISIWIAFILCSTLCRAENDSTFTHNFDDLVRGGHLPLAKPYTQGVVDGNFVYTCSGSAKFWVFEVTQGNSKYTLDFTGVGDTVATSLIRNLKYIKFYTYSTYNSFDASSIKVRLSTDGVNWGEPLQTTNLTSGSCEVNFTACDYYVKICTTSNKAFSVFAIEYKLSRDFCNCFIYTP